MTSTDTTACARCASPHWIGDQFCRSCGTAALGTADGSSFHEIDLADDQAVQSPQRQVNLIALIGLVALLIAGIVGFNALSGDSDDSMPEADNGLDATPLPNSGLPDNPPEREAAQNAFETARERNDLTLAEVKSEFGIEGDVVVLDRTDTSRWAELGQRGQPWSELGPAQITGYRIDPRTRAAVQRWEPAAAGSWVSTDLTSVIPMNSLAMSPSHIATEAGARVRIRNRTTAEQSASLAGRLFPSTGNGFLVQQCGPECRIVRLLADGTRASEYLSAEAYAPSIDATARISPDATMAAFVDDMAVIWDFEAGRSFAFGIDGVVDLAWLPDSSGLVMLGPDSAWIQRFDGSRAALPIEIDGGWAIGLTTPER